MPVQSQKKKNPAKMNFNNGFIYAFANAFILVLRYISMVELFKWMGSIAGGGPSAKSTKEHHRAVSNFVDLYTLIKWILIIVLWMADSGASWVCVLAWYLVFSNLHTYIYYFLWKQEPIDDPDRIRKRFVKLIVAIMFSHLSFAFMINTFYHEEFHWDANASEYWQSIWFSISNSIAGNYNKVYPNTPLGESIAMIQYIMTFLFVGVLISKATPQKP